MSDTRNPRQLAIFGLVAGALLVSTIGMLIFGKRTLVSWLILAPAIANFMALLWNCTGRGLEPIELKRETELVWPGHHASHICRVIPMDLLKAEQFEETSSNWTLGVLYHSAADPRWIVPMRYTNAAWSPNIAHARAVLLAIGILALGAAPAAIAGSMGRLHESNVAVGVAIWFFVWIIPPGVLARYRSDYDVD